MASALHSYVLEAGASERVRTQMNIYLHLYLYNKEGEQIGMVASDSPGAPPERSDTEMPLRVESSVRAAAIRVCFYAVPLHFPASRQVADSPSEKLTLKIIRDGEIIDTLDCTLNPWGGNQLIGLEYQ